MASRFRLRGWLALFAAMGLFVGGSISIEGADPSAPAAKPPKADGATKDPFAVPDLKPAELLKWIQKGEKYQPQVSSNEELVEFMKKSRHALVEAADKILEGKTSDSIRLAAIKSKFAALLTLEKIGDPDAPKLLKAFGDQLKDEKLPEAVHLSKWLTLKVHLSEAGDDPAALGKAWGELKREVAASPNDKSLLDIAVGFADGVERSLPGRAPKILNDVVEMLHQSKDSKMEETAKKFEGIARRLTLLGKPVEIKGTLLDGKPFDQGTLQGKVVLLDFWATWCGPCLGELPNVKENYEKYHSKGFEVVGVSLDQSPEDLQKFLEAQKITWPILFPKDKKDQFWRNPLAVYYGVNAIPCAILTNQKGEVISLQAHGVELSRRLEEMLGKADEKANPVK